MERILQMKGVIIISKRKKKNNKKPQAEVAKTNLRLLPAKPITHSGCQRRHWPRSLRSQRE